MNGDLANDVIPAFEIAFYEVFWSFAEDFVDVWIAEILSELTRALPAVVGEDSSDSVVESSIAIAHVSTWKFDHFSTIW